MRVYSAPPEGGPQVNPDGTHAPFEGRHNHHHALYGEQEPGTLHSHSHEHGTNGIPDANHGHHRDYRQRHLSQPPQAPDADSLAPAGLLMLTRLDQRNGR